MELLKRNAEAISKICAQSNVKSLFAFGSFVKGNYNSDSDVDLVVELKDKDPLIYANNYFNLKFQLEKLLNKHIDLLEVKALHNKYLRTEIEKTKVLVYAGTD